MKRRIRVSVFLVVVSVLFVLALAPVAAAERPAVVAGAGAGSGLYSTTVEYRVHFSSKTGGQLAVDMWSSAYPDLTGTFSAALAKDGYTANEYGFSTVATVMASDNPTYFVGRQFVFACSDAEEGDYLLLGDWLPVMAGRGHLTIRF